MNNFICLNKIMVKRRSKSPKWITRKGKLGGKGFLSKSVSAQHRLLNKCVRGYGYRSCLGSVMVLNRNSVIRRKHGAKIDKLKRYLMNKYGKSKSRKPKRKSVKRKSVKRKSKKRKSKPRKSKSKKRKSVRKRRKRTPPNKRRQRTALRRIKRIKK